MASTPMDNIVQGPLLDELPSEMLEEILHHIPTSDLLRSCRLVSQKWSQIATIECRNRQVSVNLTHALNYSCQFAFRETFMNASIIPWTSAKLAFHDNSERNGFNAKLCEDFGTQIQSLSTSTVFSPARTHFLSALRHLPNLRLLDISVLFWDERESPEAQPFTFPQQGELELLQLKHLRITNSATGYYQYFEFLEFMLLNSGAQFESVYIQYTDVNASRDEFKKIIQLLCTVNANIPKLSLKLCYGVEEHADAWALLAQQQFHIHRLYVKFYSYGQAKNWFNFLEQFLNNSVGLTVLCLEDFKTFIPLSSVISSFCQALYLPDLKTLTLTFSTWNVIDDGCRPRFKAANLPKLKNVELHYDPHPSKLHILDIGQIFEPNGFHNVRYLNVDYRGNGGRICGMSSVFPNITKIRASVKNDGQISSLLRVMNHVTSLHVELNSKDSDEDLLFIVAIQSMLPLINLQILSLDFRWTQKSKMPLYQIDALVLMQLRPLNLNIVSRELKETNPAVVRLRNHHIRVQSSSNDIFK